MAFDFVYIIGYTIHRQLESATGKKDGRMTPGYGRKIPKYMQIHHWVRALIDRGEIRRGDRLPTETELSRMFSVNRMTVRKAMDMFVTDGMIHRQPGKGTFLVAEKPEDLVYTLKNITSFIDDMQSAGQQPAYHAIDVKVLQPPDEVAGLLRLKKDHRAIYSLRVLHANDEPVLIEKSYLPYSRFKAILDMDFNTTLYRILTDTFNITLHHATQCLTAVFSNKEETRVFGLSKPCPCMKMETVLYDSGHSPVEALFACYRGDKYKFRFRAGHYKRRVPA